jgi:thiol-disulfide isomerase/thioredoxin
MRLKQRFAAWSLAVLGTISASGMVSLPSDAWAQDDTTNVEKAKKEDGDGEKELSREEFARLMNAGQLDEAAARVDAGIEKDPDNRQLQSFELSIAMRLAQGKPEAAIERLENIMKRILAKGEIDLPSAMLLAQATSYRVQVDRKIDPQNAVAMLKTSLEKIDSFKPAANLLFPSLIRFYINSDQKDAAKNAMDDRLAEAKAEMLKDGSTIASYATTVTLYQRSLEDVFPEATKAVVEEAESMFKDRVSKETASVQDFSAFANLKMSQASSLIYSNATEANNQLATIEALLEKAKERFSDEDLKGLRVIEQSISGMKRSLESALMRDKLVGTDAPEIQALHFVAGKPVTMQELRGKVVLLDFWAVWCGPCIATFPHLIDWHEKYSERGLVILGATNFYGYHWDSEAGKAAKPKEDVAPEDELAMLEKFRESHKLRHAFFVSDKANGYAKSFGVSGIPQAVLIDKQGKVQMIRVGSGEANAKALEAKIEELLGQ